MADEISDLLNQVGNVLASDREYPLDGTFLYVEAEPQMVSASVFKDLGESLLYREEMDDLPEVLLNLWYAEPPEKRWTSMQLHVEGGKFEASFGYEPLDPEVTTIDRRETVLQQRYGNKRIVYPPLD